jgi:hypothetical protein
MRTTLDIDDEVLRAAKELARLQGRTAGEVVSDLARQGLRAAAAPSSTSAETAASFYGFRPIGPVGSPVSNETVDRVREESGV